MKIHHILKNKNLINIPIWLNQDIMTVQHASDMFFSGFFFRLLNMLIINCSLLVFQIQGFDKDIL